MRRMRRCVALLTCVIFLQTSLFSSSPAHAAPIAADAFPVLPLRFEALQIPEEIGKVDDSFTGTSNFKVIVVQDAHAIPDAQRSIRKAILYFHQKYGINLVALEGASAKLDARMLKSFPDKERLNKVLSEYFDQGELAGGTAAAISGIKAEDNSAAGTRMIFQGVEDWPVYEEALGLYLEAMGKEKEVLEEVEGRRLKVEGEKQNQYSADLQKIDGAIKAFRGNSSDFMKTLEVLAAVRTPEKGSELELLLQESKNQGRDQTGAEIEVKKIVTVIRQSDAWRV
ncbi:MAG: hypothetical protein KBC91_04345, partial [Candidatus Omnitrophica bacterium]|nr:hypothetical protein [Candidatus Omnitrophota bacterium]